MLVQRATTITADRLLGAEHAVSPGLRTLWRARLLRVVVVALTDAAALTLAGAGAYLLWARLVRGQPLGVYVELLPMILLFLLAYAKGGLYPGFGLGAVETVRRLLLWTSFTFVVVAASSFALRAPHHYSRMAFVLAWAFALVLVPLVRFAVLRWACRWSWWREPAVILGVGPQTRRAVRTLNSAVSIGYRPVAALTTDQSIAGTAIEGVPVLDARRGGRELAAAGVRVAFVEDEGGVLENARIDFLYEYFRHVIVLRSLAEVPVEGVLIRNLGGVLGMEFTNQLLRQRNRLIKRILDLLLGAVALVLALPIILLAALVVKLVDPGPAFYSQEREGLGGERLRIRKLRTMYVDAEERLERHLRADPAAHAEWQRCFKLQDDPRVLPVVGTLLRRFSLDELPQLFQVLRGDMSLVGPRPFPRYHLDRFSPAVRSLRRRVRPGLTGLWQVMVRSDGGVEDQELYDTYYIRNWSIWMDVYILSKTAFVVLSGKGAY